jgi:uncharacterized protein (TIGR02466 family)
MRRRVVSAFASPITRTRLAFRSDDVLTTLAKEAVRGCEAVSRTATTTELAPFNHLPGGRPSAVNARFFQRQWETFCSSASSSSTASLNADESSALVELRQQMRSDAARFLELHGTPPREASRLSHGPMFIWASVHHQGSCHPPHVHSDSVVTGTFYAATPRSSAPIIFDDPRGKTPHDIMVRVEQNLLHGTGDVDSGYAPFHTPYVVHPTAGELIVFPPFLVHQVPRCESVEARVSYSFNLFGAWTAVPETATR